MQPEFVDVHPEDETDVIVRTAKDQTMPSHAQPQQQGHGSGGYRMDQRDLLKWILAAATLGTASIITWLVLQAFDLKSGVSILNLKVDLMMEKMRIEQPKAAK